MERRRQVYKPATQAVDIRSRWDESSNAEREQKLLVLGVLGWVEVGDCFFPKRGTEEERGQKAAWVPAGGSFTHPWREVTQPLFSPLLFPYFSQTFLIIIIPFRALARSWFQWSLCGARLTSLLRPGIAWCLITLMATAIFQWHRSPCISGSSFSYESYLQCLCLLWNLLIVIIFFYLKWCIICKTENWKLGLFKNHSHIYIYIIYL